MSFDLILADPPWRYSFAPSKSRRVENQYPTMSVEEICNMHLPVHVADHAVLYLWATAPKLREALSVMEAWGFEYKTHAIWPKRRLGMGYWFRNQHELLLVGVRGKVSPPAPANRTSSLIPGVHSTHSRKPESVREMLERQHPEKLKIELFARSPRKGWMVWGNALPPESVVGAA